MRGSKGSKVPESDWRPKATKGLQRLPSLPEAPGKFQGPREAQGGSGVRVNKREQGEVRGSKGSKSSESHWRPKAAEGFQRLPRLPEAQESPRSPGRDRKAQGQVGARGSERKWGGEGEQGKHCPWVWLKTQGCQRLVKASKASWGPRKVPGTQGGIGRLRGWEGVRGVRGALWSKAPESDWRPKAKAAKGLLPSLPYHFLCSLSLRMVKLG